MPEAPRTYTASCHCGAINFSFQSKPISQGCRCNCSICARKGAVMSMEYLRLENLQGQESLAVYNFGDHQVAHCFCKTCGVYPFHFAYGNPDYYRVNLGCVDGLEPTLLEISFIDGKAF